MWIPQLGVSFVPGTEVATHFLKKYKSERNAAVALFGGIMVLDARYLAPVRPRDLKQLQPARQRYNGA
jgi:hypothetical protein